MSGLRERRFTLVCASMLAALSFWQPATAAPIVASVVGEVKETEVDDDVRFANAQGADDQFVSYIVMDFDSSPLAGTTEIPALKFSLTQANAAFTTDGGLEFFVSQDTATDITPGVSALRATQTVQPSGIVAGDLSPLTSLGFGTFTETATGDVDMFTFAVDDSVESYLLSQISGGGSLRFVVAASELATQATYAGTGGGSDGTLAAPMMEIVPEPSSALLLGIASLGLLAARNRRKDI